MPIPAEFPVYSISKPFLAQAVLELGLDLKAPIGNYLPHLSATYQNRQVGQLLNHTSGLDDYGSMPEYHSAVASHEPAWSREQLLEIAERLPHANSGFQYSNIGYLLLRMAVENQTGLRYFGALTKVVFEPLGIQGFNEWEEENYLVPSYDPRWVYSGTFVSRSDALIPALQKLVAHRKQTAGLEAGLVNVPYPNTGFDQPAYNYGFMLDSNPVTAAGHGGGGPGYQLMALVNPETGIADFEIATDGSLDQAQAIGRLRAKLGV